MKLDARDQLRAADACRGAVLGPATLGPCSACGGRQAGGERSRVPPLSVQVISCLQLEAQIPSVLGTIFLRSTKKIENPLSSSWGVVRTTL